MSGSPGKALISLCSPCRSKRLRLVIAVPEAYTGYLNDKNEVTFSVKSLPDQQFKAQVKRMAGAIDSKLRSERIEMDVANNDKKIITRHGGRSQPSACGERQHFCGAQVGCRKLNRECFVIRAVGNKAERVPVKTGREANSKIEIYGDLHEGDTLLITASDEIKTGSDLTNLKTVTPLISCNFYVTGYSISWRRRLRRTLLPNNRRRLWRGSAFWQFPFICQQRWLETTIWLIPTPHQPSTKYLPSIYQVRPKQGAVLY